MILRLFFARPRPGRAAEYGEYLKRSTVPHLRGVAGCLEVRVARTFSPEGEVDFVVATLWDTLDHLKDAAGATWAEPVVAAEEAPFLASADCRHFEEL